MVALVLFAFLFERDVFLKGYHGWSQNVMLVRTGHQSAYPKIPIGKAIDSFLAHPEWEGLADYVNVRGTALLTGKHVRILLQFKVDSKTGTFNPAGFEVNDIPQNGSARDSFLKEVLEEYKP